MTIGSIQDRRQFAQEQLAAMTSQIGTEHPETLRALATSVLPATATVIGTLNNGFRPDYLAVHFDLSTLQGTGRRRDYVTLAQVQRQLRNSGRGSRQMQGNKYHLN